MKCEIPGTAREIVESLQRDYDYTVKMLAEKLGVSVNTIYRIRKGRYLDPRIHIGLIQFYIQNWQQKGGM